MEGIKLAFKTNSSFISKTAQDTTIVTTENEQELVRDLSNDANSNDFEF